MSCVWLYHNPSTRLASGVQVQNVMCQRAELSPILNGGHRNVWRRGEGLGGVAREHLGLPLEISRAREIDRCVLENVRCSPMVHHNIWLQLIQSAEVEFFLGLCQDVMRNRFGCMSSSSSSSFSLSSNDLLHKPYISGITQCVSKELKGAAFRLGHS